MTERDGHVSLWHPWQDRPGQRHKPVLLGEEELSNMSIEQFIHHIGGRQLYCLTNDILDGTSTALLRHKDAEPYMSRTQKIVGLRLKSSGKSGFLIPFKSWGCKSDRRDVQQKVPATMNSIFRMFGYEAITPASLSEKVLRSTLPAKTIISRPSSMLRRSLLEYSIGGRIDTVRELKHYHKVYNYDENKSYLEKAAKGVPSPFRSPDYLIFSPGDDRWYHYAASWIKCTLTAHGSGISPIQLADAESGNMRQPMEGEVIDRWLWDDELRDCLEAGYTLDFLDRGYCWPELSTFMAEWADILWYKLEECENQMERDIIKTMMVGLPGRFLKSPEQYVLVHESEARDTDIAVLHNWTSGGMVSTPWFIRAEYNLESSQLTYIGSYIVMKARQKLYRFIKEEERRGNEFVRSYIDCASFAGPIKQVEMLGKERGMYKQKIDEDVYVLDNLVIPRNIHHMKAPGYEEGNSRKELWRKYHESPSCM